MNHPFVFHKKINQSERVLTNSYIIESSISHMHVYSGEIPVLAFRLYLVNSLKSTVVDFCRLRIQINPATSLIIKTKSALKVQ